MSDMIRCKRYGHGLAQKTGGGDCVCAPGECRDRGEKRATVDYRLGDHTIKVSAADKIELETDGTVYGNVFVSIDWETGVGTRIDPVTVSIRAPRPTPAQGDRG